MRLHERMKSRIESLQSIFSYNGGELAHPDTLLTHFLGLVNLFPELSQGNVCRAKLV